MLSMDGAFLARYISENPVCNRCHATALVLLGKKIPRLDAEVLVSKVWSKILSYLNKP